MIKRIYLEITNRCNLRCSFCAFHHREMKEMTLEEIRSILPMLKEVTDYLYLHVQGEPLLHSRFTDILEVLDQEGFKVQLVTNGTLLPKYIDMIMAHPCIRKLAISLQSIDQHSNNELEEFIPQFLAYLKHHDHPYVELRFWAKEALGPRAKRIDSWLNSTYSFEETSRPNSYLIDDKVFVHYDSLFAWPALNDQNNTSGTCHGGRDMIAILSNGTVVPCCLDAEGVIELGNIFTTPLRDILSSSRYLNMFEGFKRNELTEPLCRSCTYRHRFD